MVELHGELSIAKQCNLLSIPRSTFYYKPVLETALNLELMKIIDMQYLEAPYYGKRRMHAVLRQKGYKINVKRIRNLMKKMRLEPLYPKPQTSLSSKDHYKFPYLLKNLDITFPNHVWAVDITYIPTVDGYLYLVAIIDIFSRFILSWRLSNSLEMDFCIEALEDALSRGKPAIFNSDQGVQFTSGKFIKTLQASNISISMDGRGRYADNIFIERFWRSLKYEEVYLKAYESGQEAYEGIKEYIGHYNTKRLHQALDYRTPQLIYEAA